MKPVDFSPLGVFEREALSAITEILRVQRKLIIAYSGGKDSTAMLLMALNAARTLSEKGVRFPSILISHGDTGIENPTVVSLVRNELRKATKFGADHGFEVRAEIAYPALLDTWAVSILSGRKLPTFPNSSSRDCTQMYKIAPMELLRNKILKAEKGQVRGGAPVTLIGTRFEESDGRATRMNERGETAYTPWEKDGAFFLSPIANWTSDDVWEYLGSYKNEERHGFTNAIDVWDMYSDAGGGGGTCAIVADMATERVKKARACGARFGCALCAAVGVDKSMEAMLSLPKFSWLRNLNRVQRFISNTAWDWSRRTWVGRTIVDGYLPIGPDTYSPAMLQELLRYTLTADAVEAADAYRGGFAPRFQIVTPEALLAIDALWSLHGIQSKPFAALNIWNEVYTQRKRFYPPELEAVAHTPMPKVRYLKVGADWDGGVPHMYSGFRSAMHEGFAGQEGQTGVGCTGTRTLEDGRTLMDMTVAPRFNFDPEAVNMFFDFEAEYVLEQYYERGAGPTSAFMHYASLGMMATSEGHASGHLDRIMRRTSWRYRNGLCGPVEVDALLAKTATRKEMLADLSPEAASDHETRAAVKAAKKAAKNAVTKAGSGALPAAQVNLLDAADTSAVIANYRPLSRGAAVQIELFSPEMEPA